MHSVFVLQHVRLLPDGAEDAKLIGVYRSRGSAEAVAARLAMAPGFVLHPHIVGPERTDDPQGFCIDEYVLDRDHWGEGFITT